jgi:hypothetical protein
MAADVDHLSGRRVSLFDHVIQSFNDRRQDDRQQQYFGGDEWSVTPAVLEDIHTG